VIRHWVNFGLLFSFAVLMTSGALAYLRPFSIVNARVHILFGALAVLLVVLHLVSRLPYFAGKLAGKSASRGMVAGVAGVCLGLLALALAGLWPVKPLMEGTHEARRRAEIVRSSPLAGFLADEESRRLVARAPGKDADTAVSLMVRFREGLEAPPAMAVWAETSTGTIIETLYLDEALAFGETVEWQGLKLPRHKLLPIWRHRHTMVSGIDPHGKVDAFTGSTPSHSFTLDRYLNSQGEGGFVLCVEVNAARDPNKAFADADLGQPSLLYTVHVEPGGEPAYALMELTAHGGEADQGGVLAYDFEGIDSARRLIDLLLVKTARVKP
jgi:hypothetical protein